LKTLQLQYRAEESKLNDEIMADEIEEQRELEAYTKELRMKKNKKKGKNDKEPDTRKIN